MADRKEAISHLQIMHTWAEFAMEKDINYFTNYHFMKIVKWTEEALELLKEQEPIEVDYKKIDDEYQMIEDAFTCKCCGAWWMMPKEDLQYCPKCGKAVKWDAAD